VTGATIALTGSVATAVFSVAQGCSDVSVALGVYSVASSGSALLGGTASGSFQPGGPYSLTAPLSSCLYRVELVRGDLPSTLAAGAYGSGELARADGGSACPPPTPTPTPTPTPPPTPPCAHGPGGGDDGHAAGEVGGQDDAGHGPGGNGSGNGNDGSRPGWGHGDRNHDHPGPPGKP
jgi:hypothetical protein